MKVPSTIVDGPAILSMISLETNDAMSDVEIQPKPGGSIQNSNAPPRWLILIESKLSRNLIKYRIIL